MFMSATADVEERRHIAALFGVDGALGVVHVTALAASQNAEQRIEVRNISPLLIRRYACERF